ncbi:MAG: helix-turn-helix domain-containing protein [Actinobacteria bacterium]|nr:helix-turn-helix domain-containing protein [Actinomycetota bacterium]
METLTIAEAAEASGLTKKAIRNRVDRGQLRAVLRDGVRRIPRSEIERAGLSAEPQEAGEGAGIRQEATPGQPQEATGWTELLGRLERQAGELAELRQLTREAESLQADRDRLEEAYHRERAEKQAAEQRIEQLANASWRERRRLLRELRSPASDRPGVPAP